MDFYLYLLVMAGSTYLIRAVPFAMIQNKIENRMIRSFLYYIPYAVLTAMTVPAVFYAADHMIPAAFGLLSAIIFALREKSLTTVAVAACAAVYITEGIMKYFA